MYQDAPPCQVTCDPHLALQCKELDFLSSSVVSTSSSTSAPGTLGANGRPILDDVTLATGDPSMLASATESRSAAKRNQRRESANARCRGFVYVMDDGELISVPCDAFDPRLVTLEDDPLQDASLPQGIRDQRGRILRVFYISSSEQYIH